MKKKKMKKKYIIYERNSNISIFYKNNFQRKRKDAFRALSRNL